MVTITLFAADNVIRACFREIPGALRNITYCNSEMREEPRPFRYGFIVTIVKANFLEVRCNAWSGFECQLVCNARAGRLAGPGRKYSRSAKIEKGEGVQKSVTRISLLILDIGARILGNGLRGHGLDAVSSRSHSAHYFRKS